MSLRIVPAGPVPVQDNDAGATTDQVEDTVEPTGFEPPATQPDPDITDVVDSISHDAELADEAGTWGGDSDEDTSDSDESEVSEPEGPDRRAMGLIRMRSAMPVAAWLTWLA